MPARLFSPILIFALLAGAPARAQSSEEFSEIAPCAGLYKTVSPHAAAECFRPLAKRGNVAAQFLLGNMYYDGDGVAQNKQTAAAWVRLAAEQGYAEAQLALGVMYGEGEGVARDKQATAEWFRRAAAQGHTAAQLALGAMYSAGDGVAQDFREAYIWFALAAADGYGSAVAARDAAGGKLPAAELQKAQEEAKQRQAEIDRRAAAN